jgi:hypothetical protein
MIDLVTSAEQLIGFLSAVLKAIISILTILPAIAGKDLVIGFLALPGTYTLVVAVQRAIPDNTNEASIMLVHHIKNEPECNEEVYAHREHFSLLLELRLCVWSPIHQFKRVAPQRKIVAPGLVASMSGEPAGIAAKVVPVFLRQLRHFIINGNFSTGLVAQCEVHSVEHCQVSKDLRGEFC